MAGLWQYCWIVLSPWYLANEWSMFRNHGLANAVDVHVHGYGYPALDIKRKDLSWRSSRIIPHRKLSTSRGCRPDGWTTYHFETNYLPTSMRKLLSFAGRGSTFFDVFTISRVQMKYSPSGFHVLPDSLCVLFAFSLQLLCSLLRLLCITPYARSHSAPECGTCLSSSIADPCLVYSTR